MEKANLSGSPTAAITLDAEKVFDKVDWIFLRMTLEKFNLGSTLINMIMALYKGPSAKVKAGGAISSSFLLKQGMRQGHPLSPSLFLLAIEPVLHHLKENRDITGLAFGKTIVKVAAYGDDVLVVTENAEKAITALMKSIQEYSSVSGYTLNKDKTEVKFINNQGDKEVLGDSGLKWQTGMVKYLALEFTNNLITTLKENESILLKKITELLNGWSPKCLSWWGRV